MSKKDGCGCYSAKDYLMVLHALPAHGSESGETPRRLAIQLGATVGRTASILEWLHERNLVVRETLGTRQDPHNDRNRVPIYTYRQAEEVTDAQLLAAIHRAAKKVMTPSRHYDFGPLVAAWK
jgi:fatty-acid desaturase